MPLKRSMVSKNCSNKQKYDFKTYHTHLFQKWLLKCSKTSLNGSNKQTQDFLTYEKLNLTWFAFNFVLIVLPPFLMFTVDHEHDGNNLNGRDESFEYSGHASSRASLVATTAAVLS